MRVELLYAPGCSNYAKARKALEAAIAEERLPIPIEFIEHGEQEHGSPEIRINGHSVVHARHHFEILSSVLSSHWRDITHKQLLPI